jgi:hypothetical protein
VHHVAMATLWNSLYCLLKEIRIFVRWVWGGEAEIALKLI